MTLSSLVTRGQGCLDQMLKLQYRTYIDFLVVLFDLSLIHI